MRDRLVADLPETWEEVGHVTDYRAVGYCRGTGAAVRYFNLARKFQRQRTPRTSKW